RKAPVRRVEPPGMRTSWPGFPPGRAGKDVWHVHKAGSTAPSWWRASSLIQLLGQIRQNETKRSSGGDARTRGGAPGTDERRQKAEERVILHGRLRSMPAPPPPAGPS